VELQLEKALLSQRSTSYRFRGIRVEIVNSLDQLETRADAWNRLSHHSPQQLPMLSHAWVSSFLEHRIKPGQSWFCLFAYDDEAMIGVFPVIVTAVSLLGIKLQRLMTPHCDHTFGVDFLVASGREKDVISALQETLKLTCPGYCELSLKRLPESSPSLALLGNLNGGRLVLGDFSGTGAFIRVSGDYENYLEGLTIRFKRNLRRLGRKMKSLPDVRYSFLTGKDAAGKTLGEFLELEASGWKTRGGSAILNAPSLIPFYSALARRLSELGWLELHCLHANGKMIAGHFAIRMACTLVVFKIAYDEEYASYSPGTLLFERMIKRGFESGGLNEINFLSDHEWMKNWGVAHRAYYNLYVVPRKFIPVLVSFLPAKFRVVSRHMLGLHPFSDES